VHAIPARTSRQPFVIAHRGGNHLDALRDAERLGIPLVEADLRLFQGRIDVRHLKSIGPLPLFWDRWRVAAPWSARLGLDELLDATGPGTELMLDLKGRRRELAVLVADAISPLLPSRRFTVCARAASLLEPFAGLSVRRFQSVGSARQLRRFLERGHLHDVDGVSIHARLLAPRTMDALRSRVRLVVTWPVNRVEHALDLAALGVDGLISDVPGVLLAREGDA
jgi:glycerophosphoryl diester phosphodiesterase